MEDFELFEADGGGLRGQEVPVRPVRLTIALHIFIQNRPLRSIMWHDGA
jgi:hypothetical protein